MKLRERNISRTITVTTCIVSIYDRASKSVGDVTAYVTGYTEPEDISAYLSNHYNTKEFVMLDYCAVRKRVIKATMSEQDFRINSSWEVISDVTLTDRKDDTGEAVEE